MALFQKIDDLPDTGIVWTLIATRPLTDYEQTQVCRLIDGWIDEWSGFYPECPITHCLPLYRGQLFVWGGDTTPRLPPEISSGISNSELDPLWHSLEAFGMAQRSPFRIFPNLALLVANEVLPMIIETREYWKALAREGKITPDTLLINTCTVAEWRSGRFVRRLGDEMPGFAEQLRTLSSS